MKDEYLRMKEEGMTDKEIMKEWDIDHNRMQKFKRKNGLIGKFGRKNTNGAIKSLRKGGQFPEIKGPSVPNVTPKDILNNKKVGKQESESVDTTPKKVTINPFGAISSEIADLLQAKDSDYGQSFSKLFDEYGDLSVVIRLSDKLERYKTLIDKGQKVTDESIEDTLRDIAGYAILTLHERRKRGA